MQPCGTYGDTVNTIEVVAMQCFAAVYLPRLVAEMSRRSSARELRSASCCDPLISRRGLSLLFARHDMYSTDYKFNDNRLKLTIYMTFESRRRQDKNESIEADTQSSRQLDTFYLRTKARESQGITYTYTTLRRFSRNMKKRIQVTRNGRLPIN